MELSVTALIILIVVLLVVFGGTVFVLLAYSGLLYRPQVKTQTPPLGRAVIAYKFVKGPYSSVGHYFNEIISLLPKSRGIGIYYDNPNTVPEEELRSAVGCIIQDAEEPALVDETTKSLLSNHGFKLRSLPAVESAVVTDFPYTTPVSLLLGPSRVYPLLNQYIEERGLCAYPMLEVYTGDKINYFAPLSKQVDFFVPETSPDFQETEEEEEEVLVSQSEDEIGSVTRKESASAPEPLSERNIGNNGDTSTSGSFEKVTPPLED